MDKIFEKFSWLYRIFGRLNNIISAYLVKKRVTK